MVKQQEEYHRKGEEVQNNGKLMMCLPLENIDGGILW